MCFFENTFFGNEKFMCILHKVTTMWEREWKFFFSCECRILAANSKGLALRLKTAFSLTQDMQMLKIDIVSNQYLLKLCADRHWREDSNGLSIVGVACDCFMRDFVSTSSRKVKMNHFKTAVHCLSVLRVVLLHWLFGYFYDNKKTSFFLLGLF